MAQTSKSGADTPEAGASGAAAIPPKTAGTAATVPRPLNLKELQDLSAEKLESVARELNLQLFPGRSRHFHILDVIRAALSRGGTVTADGFLDEVGESFGVLRSTHLNFCRFPKIFPFREP